MFKKRNSRYGVLLLLCLLLLFPVFVSAQEQESYQGLTENSAGMAGLEEGTKTVEGAYHEGEYLGDFSFVMDTLSVNGEYIIEPIRYPGYRGDRVSEIFSYLATENCIKNYWIPKGSMDYFEAGKREICEAVDVYDHSLSSNEFGIKTVRLAKMHYPRGFLYSKVIFYPREVTEYANKKQLHLEKRYSTGYPFGLSEKDLNDNSKYICYVNDKQIDKPLSRIIVGEDIKKGDVVRLSYSVFGNDRGYDTSGNKNKLLELVAKINDTPKVLDSLEENKDKKEAYEKANTVLKSLSADQNMIDKAYKDLNGKVDLGPEVPSDIAKSCAMYEEFRGEVKQDFLLSNLTYTMKVGEEMELYCLDLPRAGGQNNCYQRDDLIYEPVIGGDKVEIKKTDGSLLTIPGKNSRIPTEGSAYFLRGLKEGLVVLKVHYPYYNGRPNYILVYISDRPTDYGEQRLKLDSNLDRTTKYDVFHYTKEQNTFPVTVNTDPGSSLTVLVNGKEIVPTDSGGGKYTFDMPLQNYWTNVLMTVEKGGKKTSKVYNLRSAYIEYHIPKDIKVGEKVTIGMDGLIGNTPKIGKFYNRGREVQYTLGMKGYPYISGFKGSTAYEDWALSFTPTESGTFTFKDGKIHEPGFNWYEAWAEVPKKQMPEYTKIDSELIGAAGGQNAPQMAYVHYFMPDFTIEVKENPEAKPVDFISITPDKEIYKPGETVHLTVGLSDEFLQQLNEKHKMYINEKLPGGVSDNSYEHIYTTQINEANIILASNIPGLGEITTSPTVDTKIYPQYKRKDYEGKPANDPIFHLDEKLERLNKLKEVSFTIPDDTPNGEYNLMGYYLKVNYGPVWGMKRQRLLIPELGNRLKIRIGGISDFAPTLEEIGFPDVSMADPTTGVLRVSENRLKAKTYEDRLHLELSGRNINELDITADGKKLPVTKDGDRFVTDEFDIQDKSVLLIRAKGIKDQISEYELTIEKADVGFNDDDLKALIEKGEALKASDYQEDDFNRFKDVLKNAKEVLQSAETQDEIDKAAEELQKAFNQLTSLTPDENWKPDVPETVTVPENSDWSQVMDQLPGIWRNGKKDVEILWDTGGIDLSTPGTYTLIGSYTDPGDGLEKFLEVSLVVEEEGKDSTSSGTGKKYQSIYEPMPVTLYVGDNLKLPSTVEVVNFDNTIKDASVTWDTSNVDVSRPGTYFAQGTVNSLNEKPVLRIEVRNKPGEALSPSQSEIGQAYVPVNPAAGPSDSRLEPVDRFKDMKNHWARNVVNYSVQKGFFQGTSEDRFSPNREATRGEFMTVLGRIAGINPDSYRRCSFSDVPSGAFYEPYINWGVKAGLVKGVGSNRFEPDRSMTREEMAVILDKYLSYIGEQYSAQGAKNYRDEQDISHWAKDAVDRMTVAGLLRGRDGNRFAPKASFTRAELAQVIYNLEHR